VGHRSIANRPSGALRRALGAVLVAVFLITTSGPAAGQRDQNPPNLPGPLIQQVSRFTVLEIALLYELDAFTSDNEAALSTIHAAYEPYASSDRGDLLRVLTAIDTKLAEQRPIFERNSPPGPDPLLFAVRKLPQGWYTRLEAGESAFIVGDEYVGALDRLARNPGPPARNNSETVDAVSDVAPPTDLNGLLALQGDELRHEVDELWGQGPTSPRTPPPASAPAPASSSRPPFAILAIIATTLLTAAVWLGRSTSRRSDNKNSTRTTTTVMDANRRLTAARTDQDIATIVQQAAHELVGGEAVLLRMVRDGLRSVDSSTIIMASTARAAMESGIPTLQLVDNDPLWPGLLVAAAFVPIVHDGASLGVLAVRRAKKKPFSKDASDQLELLVASVGGAWQTADELGSMSTLALVDGLTSLGNRRRLDNDLEAVVDAAGTSGEPVGFAMIDVDHFKHYNDTHGHSAGDAALQQVAAVIAQCVRDTDVVYRYGGEEFSILLPDATPQESAAVAERVRSAVEAMPFEGEGQQPGGRLTISIGVASLHHGTAADIRNRADAALYQAKEDGRNQVSFG